LDLLYDILHRAGWKTMTRSNFLCDFLLSIPQSSCEQFCCIYYVLWHLFKVFWFICSGFLELWYSYGQIFETRGSSGRNFIHWSQWWIYQVSHLRGSQLLNHSCAVTSSMIITNLPLLSVQFLSHHDGKWPTCCAFLAKMELVFHDMGCIHGENTVIDKIWNAGPVVKHHKPFVNGGNICKWDVKPCRIIHIANYLEVRFHCKRPFSPNIRY